MRSTRRKGFTLMEMLIVIIVIGILSSMMMMSSTEAVTSAKTSNIVSNLRNLKTAALAYYLDSMDYVAGLKKTPTNFSADVAKYLTDEKKLNEPGYDVIITAAGEWYVTYHIDGSTSEIEAIKNKLLGRAKSTRLLNAPETSYTGTTKTQYNGTDKVAMFVR